MHNIDVMHQERNVVESIVSTCLDITGKTKDNFKTRRDIAHVCNRPSLELDERGGKPCAPFCLKVKDKKERKTPGNFLKKKFQNSFFPYFPIFRFFFLVNFL